MRNAENGFVDTVLAIAFEVVSSLLKDHFKRLIETIIAGDMEMAAKSMTYRNLGGNTEDDT